MEAGGAVVRATLRCRVSVRIMPRVFYARRNRQNSPSMARFLLASASMPRHFCALQHNSTDTKQLRYSPALQYRLPPPRLTPLTLRYNVLVLTYGSDGTALSACTWEAQNLRRFPLNTLNSPESMQCVLKEIMNCHEVPYSLITKKAPTYPQSIRTWARGYLHNFLKNILHATPASSQPLCGKLKTSTASHSHHSPAKLRQRILLHS